MTDAPAAAPAEAEAPEPVEVDEVRTRMLELLQRDLGDAIVDSAIERGQLWVRVDRASWRKAVEAARDALDCDMFNFLSGIDWLAGTDLAARSFWDPDKPGPGAATPAPAAQADGDSETEAADAGEADGGDAPQPSGSTHETGIAGGDTRFQVFARLYSTKHHWAVVLKADLDEANPEVDTVTDIFRGADWHERETWEMFGFQFVGHPGLRHLYLPGAFEGFPLRKDFPLLSREVKPWPGLVDKEPMPGEDSDDEAGGDEGGGS